MIVDPVLKLIAEKRADAEMRRDNARHNGNHLGDYLAAAELNLLEEIRDAHARHIAVDKEALLIVVRRLDIDARYSREQFNHAFDKLRLAFSPDEIATGVPADRPEKGESNADEQG